MSALTGFTPPQHAVSASYGATANYVAATLVRETLVAGRRVRVKHLTPTLRGLQGVIVAGRIGDHDCAVLLDEWDHPLGFYWQEIEVMI